MYYWDMTWAWWLKSLCHGFSSCQKNVLLGQTRDSADRHRFPVSVVVRRMYYWDAKAGFLTFNKSFQQLLEECTIGTELDRDDVVRPESFSSCQKNVLLGLTAYIYGRDEQLFQQLLEECTIGTSPMTAPILVLVVSVVVRRMYYWDQSGGKRYSFSFWFQQLLEECTIGTSLEIYRSIALSSFSSCQKNVLLGPPNATG